MSEAQRQLAAIMFTDIVGFTSLMGHDENRAHQVVERNNKIQSDLVKKYGGKWHKDLGDGTLSSFNSSVNAVECAIAIQQLVNVRENFQLRIGIHLGDVTFRNGDVLGNGVNVASRIETEAVDGGICVSDSVVKSVKGNESIRSNYIGRKKLKNVSDPTRLYQIVANNVNSKKKARRPIYYLLVPTILTIMLFSGYLAWLLKPEPSKSVMRFTITLPDEVERITDIDLSNDGKTLVYAAYLEGFLGAQMFIRPINSFESSHILGGDYIDDPVFSLDNREIAFGSRGVIKLYSMETGVIENFGNAVSVNMNGISWKDESIIYAPSMGDMTTSRNLMQISKDQNENDVLISPESEDSEIDFLNPFFVPSKNILLYQVNNLIDHEIWMVNFSNSKSEFIIDAENPKYISTGHLLFKDEENLMGVAFNPSNVHDIGTPVKLIPGIEIDLFDVSSDGTLVYVEAQNKFRQPILVDVNGTLSEIPIPKVFWNGSPRWSPDESRIVFRNPATNSIWLYDVAKETSQILLTDNSNTAEWFPDGKSIAYRAGSMDAILKVDLSDPYKSDTLVTSSNSIYPVSFASNGNFMFYDEIHPVNQKNIWLYDLKNQRSTQFINTGADESMAQFSPNNELIIYCSDETGRFEIYLRRFENTGEKLLVSDGGGTEPRWSKDGKFIFYRNGNRIMRVPVKLSEKLDYGKAELLFEGPYPPSSYSITNFDCSQDGNAFLMLKPASSKNSQIHIVVNWFEELKVMMSE